MACFGNSFDFFLDGEKGRQAEEGESVFKTYTEKFMSVPTNPRLRG